MTIKELRELDARAEREIFGKCPHPVEAHKRFRNDDKAAGFVGAIMLKCGECSAFLGYDNDPRDRRYFKFYGCQEYASSWDAVMGSLVPEMERRGYHLSLAHLKDIDRWHWEARFRKPDSPHAYHQEGRIAICRAALAACAAEEEKK